MTAPAPLAAATRPGVAVTAGGGKPPVGTPAGVGLYRDIVAEYMADEWGAWT